MLSKVRAGKCVIFDSVVIIDSLKSFEDINLTGANCSNALNLISTTATYVYNLTFNGAVNLTGGNNTIGYGGMGLRSARQLTININNGTTFTAQSGDGINAEAALTINGVGAA